MAKSQALSFEATAISPVFPVTDVRASVAHYRSLGFEVEDYDGGAYAFLRAGRMELHLQQVPDLDPATSTSMCYLYVPDADSLYDRWIGWEIGGQLVPPIDTAYGVREFSHIDIDGNLLRVGSALS